MQFYREAPEPVQTYLLDIPAMEAEDKAQELLGYDHDAWNRVMDVVWDQCFLRLSESEFRTRIAQLATDRDAREVEKVILRHIILPLADLVPWDVERRLQELGCTLTEIQSVQRISLRPLSYGAAVRRIAALAKVSLLSEESLRRCRDILISYIKGVRLVEQVKEMLQRTQGEGGVGFTREQTETFVRSMIDVLGKTQVISEQEYADWFTAFQREAEAERIAARHQGQGAPVPSSASSSDQPEPDIIPQGMFTSPKAREAQTALADAVRSIYVATGWQGDEYLARRLQNIISSRLRDVRNAFQVQDMLTRDQKVGGMGLAPADAEKIAGIIEQQYQDHRGRVVEEEKQKILEVQQTQQQKIAERKQEESRAHAEWFDKKIRSTQRDEEARRAFFEQMRNAAQAQTQGAPVSTASAPVPASSAPRASVDSVTAPVRLVGLTEELGDTTLETFRRMARSPADAAKKIIQKLDALKNESFERWTEGVQAWRASPLQQTYLQLVGDSFRAGRSVVELIEERRKSDSSVLTSEEVGAILEINAHAQL